MKLAFVAAALAGAALSTPAFAQTAHPLEKLCEDTRLSAKDQEECRTKIRNAENEAARGKVIEELNKKLSSLPPAPPPAK